MLIPKGIDLGEVEAALWQGGLLLAHRKFDAASSPQAIERERSDRIWSAPVMAGFIFALPDHHKHDHASLKWVVGGGERTPEARIREFSRYFTKGRYIDAYGLTESCSGDTFMVAGREIEKIGSTGPASMHVDIEIHDDAGNTLPPGEEGEICLRGPKITRGYWKDPKKTAASFFGEWFRTGDVGYLDEDGFLFLTDRKKDMIISGGENIASSEVERASEIERVIFQPLHVREDAAISLSEECWDERPLAVAVLADHVHLDHATLTDHPRSQLALFKVSKDLMILESLPSTPSGKVLKRQPRTELGHPTAQQTAV